MTDNGCLEFRCLVEASPGRSQMALETHACEVELFMVMVSYCHLRFGRSGWHDTYKWYCALSVATHNMLARTGGLPRASAGIFFASQFTACCL